MIGVEPAGAAKMRASLDAGHPVTLPSTSTIADGLMPVRPGDLTFDHISRFADDVVTVSDEAIVEAVLWAFNRTKIVAEPSGAASLAAVLSGAAERSGRIEGPIVPIISGGNMGAERWSSGWRSDDSRGSGLGARSGLGTFPVNLWLVPAYLGT